MHHRLRNLPQLLLGLLQGRDKQEQQNEAGVKYSLTKWRSCIQWVGLFLLSYYMFAHTSILPEHRAPTQDQLFSLFRVVSRGPTLPPRIFKFTGSSDNSIQKPGF
ncbi:hypothetical protein FB451DRAFT_1182630 [Mycena latifolia]|nr:hypothetical protein FB451DRAFT_1182630 [Mycena latifolia]